MAGLASASPLSSFLHSSSHLSFASPFTAHACAHLHTSDIRCRFLVCGPPRARSPPPPFLPSSVHKGCYSVALLDIPEDELHSLRFHRRPLDSGFVWLFHTREMRAGGNLGRRRGEVPDPCLPSPAASQHGCEG